EPPPDVWDTNNLDAVVFLTATKGMKAIVEKLRDASSLLLLLINMEVKCENFNVAAHVERPFYNRLQKIFTINPYDASEPINVRVLK
ncbi:hypothetical protein M8C21_017308, partial [Ambrosia artemisiifolia]